MKKTKRFAKNLLAISLSICLSFMSVPFGTAFASDASGEISNAASAVLESDSNVAADSADVIADAVSTPEDSESSALERANVEPESLDGIISSDEEISSAASIDSIVADTESENGDSLADKPAEPYEVELTAMGMLGANTVKISVPAADAGDELRAALGSATATLDPGSADDAAHASAKAALEAKFDGVGAFEAYSLKIVSGGQEVELPASAEVELAFVRLTADAGVAMPGFMNLGMSPRYFGACRRRALGAVGVRQRAGQRDGLARHLPPRPVAAHAGRGQRRLAFRQGRRLEGWKLFNHGKSLCHW